MEGQDPCGHRLSSEPVIWLGYSRPFPHIASLPCNQKDDGLSTQTVRNAITIFPYSPLGWMGAQLSHLPTEAVGQSSLETASATAS